MGLGPGSGSSSFPAEVDPKEQGVAKERSPGWRWTLNSARCPAQLRGQVRSGWSVGCGWELVACGLIPSLKSGGGSLLGEGRKVQAEPPAGWGLGSSGVGDRGASAGLGGLPAPLAPWARPRLSPVERAREDRPSGSSSAEPRRGQHLHVAKGSSWLCA